MFTTKALRHIGSIVAIAVAIATLSATAVLFAGTSDVAAQDCDYNEVAVDGVCVDPTPTPILSDAAEYPAGGFAGAATATPVPDSNPVVAATATPVATAAPAANVTSPVPQFTG